MNLEKVFYMHKLGYSCLIILLSIQMASALELPFQYIPNVESISAEVISKADMVTVPANIALPAVTVTSYQSDSMELGQEFFVTMTSDFYYDGIDVYINFYHSGRRNSFLEVGTFTRTGIVWGR